MIKIKTLAQDKLLNLPIGSQRFIIISTLLVCAFVLTFKITEEPMHRWDESLFAKNAFHLAHEGKIPDYYYNMRGDGIDQKVTKPPFVFMIQATLMKKLGYTNNLAIRLHSIIAAYILCSLLILYSVRNLGTLFIGVFSALILITNKGYMIYHGARGGDYESLLVLFMSMAAYFYYMAINRDKYLISRSDLYLTAFCISLAVLTKSIAGLLFLPGFIFYALYKKKVKLILFSRCFYISIAILLIPIVSYYTIADIVEPGNFKHVLDHEVFGRYLQTLHDNDQPFYYYLKYFFATSNHTPWCVSLFLSSFVIFKSKNNKFKSIASYSLFIISFYIILISCSKTKICWYIMPCYVFISIINSMGLYIIFLGIIKHLKLTKSTNVSKLLFTFLFILMFFSLPLKKTLTQILKYKHPQHNEGYYYNIYESGIKFAYRENLISSGDSLFILRDSTIAAWSPQLNYYEDVFKHAYNIHLIQSYNPNILRKGHIVLTSDLVISKYKLEYNLINSFIETKLIIRKNRISNYMRQTPSK